MKKTLYLLLTIVLAFALCGVFAGCGSNESGEPAEETTVAAAEEEHADATNIYEAIAGDYQDKVSERASLMASADLESDCLTIIVYWSNSATESVEWTMHATMNGDNQLEYTDCVKKTIVTDEDGNPVSSDTEYKDGKGYFEYADGGELKWIGAQDEECQSCIFVQTQE